MFCKGFPGRGGVRGWLVNRRFRCFAEFKAKKQEAMESVGLFKTCRGVVRQKVDTMGLNNVHT